MLVFLVHDDQAERIHRREDGRARADGNSRAALPDFVPFIVPFTGGQMAVQHRHEGLQGPGAETRFETLDGLGRERNFRHEHNRALPPLQRVRDGLQVNLRLPAARDAVQKKGGRQNGE